MQKHLSFAAHLAASFLSAGLAVADADLGNVALECTDPVMCAALSGAFEKVAPFRTPLTVQLIFEESRDWQLAVHLQ
ncbi:hypothetical protein C1J03_19575 [Sulfitobacter sp. SK012]|uniref:hypothetical protein n=1 Tax=Sulfitobacter sp. SK012 TaxID=1389005 RepID=UPI000E0C1DFE|nr:hypothetical protein [Sulfitobacter sp. SK012]AXI48005.1 hypothetical protein C1J03_19575 [Sulfitobacter sp. SK012]